MRDAHEFKPLLVEIQERPVSRVGRGVFWAVTGLLVLGILLAVILRVDVVVSARGRFVPEADLKIMSPFETGVVRKIHVREGQFVHRGDPLIELDPSLEEADIRETEKTLRLLSFSAGRIRALLEGREFHPPEASPEARSQERLFIAQREYYRSRISQFDKRLRQLRERDTFLRGEIQRLEETLALLKEEERRYRALFSAGALPENRYREKVRERIATERTLAGRRNELTQTRLEIRKLSDERKNFHTEFRSRLLEELKEVLAQEHRLRAEWEKRRLERRRRLITSPVDGYVYLLGVKTRGSTVTSGQALVSLVPVGSPLLARVMVSNRDAGLVKVGQRCRIKVEAYDYYRYGTLPCRVERISPFSLEEEKREGFITEVRPERLELRDREGRAFRVRPGMSVNVDIRVGQRRIIQLFLSPIFRGFKEGVSVR